MPDQNLLFAVHVVQLWHLVPLVVAISFVYGATRHELTTEIVSNAVRFGAWVLGFIGVLFGVLAVIARSL